MTGHATVGAEIEVRNVIAIIGRGAVLIGYVRGGTPRIGQSTAVLDLGRSGERRLEVSAVERLSSMEAGGTAIGTTRDVAPISAPHSMDSRSVRAAMRRLPASLMIAEAAVAASRASK